MMNYKLMIIPVLTLMISGMLASAPGTGAQEYIAEPEQDYVFKKEELAQMLAPIALYPDSLISQILMASTYPLEVVEAERWLRQNRELTGEKLNDALQEMTWDPSIKSLCHFSDVLFAMSEKLDQTRKLGDAFLGQEEDVMATIQDLRHKAHDKGNLTTTREQKVIIEREIIKVEPADPRVVYVPVYDPVYVYGPWWYPAYPPWYWYYPRSVVVTGGYIHFSSGFFLGAGIFSWTWFDWPRRYIFIDVHKTRKFHRFRDRHDSDRYLWRHDARHRKGVAYRDRITTERFRPELPQWPPRTRPEMRGYPSRGVTRDVLPSRSLPERRGGDVPRVRTEPQKPGRPLGSSIGVMPGQQIQRRSDQGIKREDTPFRGIGNGHFERKAGERGGYSRQRDHIRSQDRGPQGSFRERGGDRGGSRRSR